MSRHHRGRGDDSLRAQLTSRRSPPTEHSRSPPSGGHRSDGSRSSSSSHSSAESASARTATGSRDTARSRDTVRSREIKESRDRPRVKEGYDVDLFIPKADEKYVCPICLMVLRNPLQTPCGHRFCDYCIERWSSGGRRPARCPVDNIEFSRSQLFADNYAKREIMSLNVKCPNQEAGCSQQMELLALADHETECIYGTIKCKLCSAELLRKDHSNHILKDCPERIIICEYCSTSIKHRQREDHVCAEAKCDKCFGSFLPNELSFHQQRCPKARVPCFYGYYGCRQKMLQSEEEEHMKKSVVDHLYLVTAHLVQTQQAKLYDVTRSAPITPAGPLSSVTSGYRTISTGAFSTSSSTYSRVPNLHSMEEPMSPIMMLPAFPALMTSHLAREDHMTLPIPPLTQDDMQEERPMTYPLQHKHKQRDERRPRVELGQESNLSDVVALLDRHDKIISHQENMIQRQSLKIHHLEQQVQDFEARQCNGTYIWFIRDYKRRKLEAMAGKNVVHHSPGFFTSSFGYKMCVRVNLNGVESGEGSHLSLFVHLMKGEYDDILKWPFQGNIALTLLDQRDSVDQRQNITEKLVAKPGLAAFNKPTVKRNHKGFGYIEFAPLNFIENDHYIKNDMIVVKTVVEPTGSCAS